MLLNKWWAIASVAVAVLAALGAGFYLYVFKTHPGLSPLTVGDGTVYVTIADTPLEREQGLSGRPGLLPDEGMLFVFPVEGKHAFWMKDMRFAIDIVWIANDGTVIHIEENVLPETYPTEFAPAVGLARYVLELRGGYSKEHDFAVGDRVDI